MRIKLMAFCVIFALNSVSMLYARDDTENERPMTKYEKEMLKVPKIEQLQNMWDTLSTEYDRRYFLNGLPGYCGEKNVKNVPEWITFAVKQSLRSNDPNLVCEAVTIAGKFNLKCSDELMALYPTVHTTFGNHEDILKSSIISSLKGMWNPRKEQFLYSILIEEQLPVLGATFEALVASINVTPHRMYAKKLEEYDSKIDASIKAIENGPMEKKYLLQRLSELKGKIDGAIKKVKVNEGESK